MKINHIKNWNRNIVAVCYINGERKEIGFSKSYYGEELATYYAQQCCELNRDIRKNHYILKEGYYEIEIFGYNEKIYIDEEDYELVSQYQWHLNKQTNTYYAIKSTSNSSIKMHRLIMNPLNEEIVDHINKNGLDNRKANLRIVPKYLNNRNTNLRKDNESGIIGVFYSKKNDQWRAKWYDENHKVHQKSFSCKKYGFEEARYLAIQARLDAMNENEYIYDNEMYEESSETIETVSNNN